MNRGRTVFSQLVDFLSTYQFQICVDRYIRAIATSKISLAGISFFVCTVSKDGRVSVKTSYSLPSVLVLHRVLRERPAARAMAAR